MDGGFWVQAFVCLIVWISGGWWLSRRPWFDVQSAVNLAPPRTAYALLAGAWFFLSAGWLALGLYAVQADHGLYQGHLRLWALALVLLVGAGFIAMQMIGLRLVLRLILPVTSSTAHPSIPEKDLPSDHPL